MAQGRKTLTFVEQTGTRDIRDRLKQVIETPGSRVEASPWLKCPGWAS